jgi:hypothetical protein
MLKLFDTISFTFPKHGDYGVQGQRYCEKVAITSVV